MALFARVNGVVLHHADEGPRDAPAIVFANALGTDFRIWDAVVGRLPGFRAIRYDMRGHGLSESTPPPYRMENHVADIAALMDQLGVSGATFVGLSVGGLVAQGLAAARPDLVSRLVLSGTAAKIGTTDSWNARIDATMKSGIASFAEGVLEKWFTPAFRAPENAVFAGYRAMLTRSPVDGYVGSCAALRDCDYTDKTRRLALPTLVMVGDQDGSTPPDLVRGLAGLIAGARFELIAGAAHLPGVERPDETARLIAAHASA